jgi:hypothetical protein
MPVKTRDRDDTAVVPYGMDVGVARRGHPNGLVGSEGHYGEM